MVGSFNGTMLEFVEPFITTYSLKNVRKDGLHGLVINLPVLKTP